MHSRASDGCRPAASARPTWPLVAIALVYLYSFPYFPALKHANELPRILTSEQVAERGTFRLDARLNELGSRADVSTTPDGHHYQNKAPGLSMLGALVYYPLSRVFGRRPPLMLVTWVLRLTLAIVPTLLFVVSFRRVAAYFADSAEARNGALIAYFLGSMALPLGMLFMSHAIASSLVGIAFATSVATVRQRSHAEWHGASIVGSLLGLAMLCEYQALFGALVVAAYFCWGAERRGRAMLALALATTPFILGLAWYQWSAFGSPLRTGYAFSVDPANRVGLMGIVGFSRASVSQLFVRPDNGLLVLSPWVVLSAIGAVSIAARADARARVGREAAVCAVMVTVYCVFVAALEPEFGRAGWTVGPRYVAIAMPFFAWLAAAGLDACLRHETLRVPALGLIFVGAGVHVLAASTYPHWPLEFQNPLFEVSVRALREGYAPYSLGTLAGLRGAVSVAPMYVVVVVLILAVLTSDRRYVVETLLAFVIAGTILSSYRLLAATPQGTREPIWRFVASTFPR
jgi:hypothetical protein